MQPVRAYLPAARARSLARLLVLGSIDGGRVVCLSQRPPECPSRATVVDGCVRRCDHLGAGGALALAIFLARLRAVFSATFFLIACPTFEP